MAESVAPKPETEPPSPRDDRWYVFGGGGAAAPLTFAELQREVAAGRLARAHLVRTTDEPVWVPAGLVPGLVAPPSALDAAAPRPGAGARPTWPADTLPLWITAGIVVCFILHFGQERFRTPAAAAPAAAAGSRAAAGAGPTGELYDLEVCNHTPAGRLFVAVAYYDALQADWVARGWYPATQGLCRLGLRRLPPPVYVYAETADGAGRWDDARGVPFCVAAEGGFVLAQRHCAEASGRGQVRLAHFRRLVVSGAGGLATWDLTP